MASKRHCLRALDLHEEYLSSLENVVGLGIVPEGDSFAVAVYVKKKLAPSALASRDLVPKHIEVPGRGKSKHNIPTRVIEQGEVWLEEESCSEDGFRG